MARITSEKLICGGCGAEVELKLAETIGVISACRHCGWPGMDILRVRLSTVRTTQDMPAVRLPTPSALPSLTSELPTQPATPSKLVRPPTPSQPTTYSERPGSKKDKL